MSTTYRIESWLARHMESPETFWIPLGILRRNLRKDDCAKLLFNIEQDGEEFTERMWVIVLWKENWYYLWILDNDPLWTEDLRAGEIIKFGPDDVIDIKFQWTLSWVLNYINRP